MKYGLDITAAGPWGHPRQIADFAALAERSGWDGIFLEDYVFFPGGHDTYDPWVTLAAVALSTERLVMGTLITPLPRRRPWKVAAEAMTVDHLSGGRVVLGVGSGDPDSIDFRCLGEPKDARDRAALLDEALEVVAGLWAGEAVHQRGHFVLDEVTMRPRPVQRPRIPIWVGGAFTRAGPRERALRWDGACLYRVPPPEWEDLGADEVRRLRRLAGARRGDDAFVIAVGGRERREDLGAEVDYVTALRDAGATWWHEYLPPRLPVATVHQRIADGPVRARGTAPPSRS